MTEYIDKEKLIRDLIDNRNFYPALVKSAIENAPTEDVVPRSEVEELETKLHLAEEAFKVASENAESARDRARSIAREIFAEIEAGYGKQSGADRGDGLTYGEIQDFFAEIEKKHIGETE